MKRLFALILTLSLLLLTACGGPGDKTGSGDASGSTGTSGDSGSSESEAPASVTKLRFNLVKSTGDPQYEWYGRFWDAVKEASGGEIEGEIFTGESLGVTADVLEQAAQGEPVVADCDLAYLANYVPDMAAVMSPYLIQEPDQILKLWDSEVFQDLCGQLEAKGLHLIALNYEGTRNLVTVKPVASRADVGPLQIRCASTTMWNPGRQSHQYPHVRGVPGIVSGRGGRRRGRVQRHLLQ